MDLFKSLTEFFYNLIPGTLLLFGFLFISNDYNFIELFSKLENTPVLFLLIITALFGGFLFQALTKMIEKLTDFREELVYKNVAKREPEVYKAAKDLLISESNIDPAEWPKKEEFTFYLMDNHIRIKNNPYMIHHFSTKAALWFNISWVSYSLFMIAWAKKNFGQLFPPSINKIEDGMIMLLLSLFIASLFAGVLYLRSQYDSTLKMFIAQKSQNNHQNP